MSDARALFRAVLDAPHDDAPRLVCADWLEDHGQPDWGEFIRLQIELARTPTDALRQRELALWPAVRDSYLADFPADRHWSVSLDLPDRTIKLPEAVVRRGFVEQVAAPTFVLGERCPDCGEAVFCETCHGLCALLDPALADLFARQPATRVELTDVRPGRTLVLRPGEADAAVEWLDAARWGGPEDDRVLPHSLFDSLADYTVGDNGRKSYPSEASALVAVGSAVVALGRRLAGLPPLIA